jgi:hypothetical protein
LNTELSKLKDQGPKAPTAAELVKALDRKNSKKESEKTKNEIESLKKTVMKASASASKEVLAERPNDQNLISV